MHKQNTNNLAKIFWGLLIFTVLSACGNSEKSVATLTLESLATEASSSTPIHSPLTPSPTPTTTNTQKPTSTPTIRPPLIKTPQITPVPTRTPPTVIPPEKHVILDYSVSGWHGFFDGYVDFSASNLVLYTDGQLILSGKPNQQKFLSTEEIDQFLFQLDSLGFYELETNQQHDPTDKLYDFGDQYQRIYDGIYKCILITGDRERNICVHNEQSEFLIPKMKNILAFLDNYQPEGMTPYEPDRILLFVMVGRTEFQENLTTIPWPEHLPSIETSEYKYMYMDGETAKEIYDLFRNRYDNVFSQNDIEYTVYLEIILPHEAVEQP